MEGIFGVGIAEVLLIGLVLFIIGGPENTVKWAGQLGRWVRKLREEFRKVWHEIEGDMDDETKEFVREMRSAADDMRSVRRSSQNIMRETWRLAEGADSQPSSRQSPASDAAPEGDAAGPGEKQYPAWLPPEK